MKRDRRRWIDNLHCTSAREDDAKGPQDDKHIAEKGPRFDVDGILLHSTLPHSLFTAADLPEAGKAGLCNEANLAVESDIRGLFAKDGARADDRHGTDDNAPELG